MNQRTPPGSPTSALQGTVSFKDGLGVRLREAAGADTIDRLVLCPELAVFEGVLRERVTRLSNFNNVRFPRVRGLDVKGTDKGRAVSVTSDPVDGMRLVEIVPAVASREVALPVGTVLQVAREVLPALATLHDSRAVTHGAIGLERLIVSPHGRILLADYALGSALERLQYPRSRLWREFRIAMPPSAGIPRFDRRADIVQVAVAVFGLVLGRLLSAREFPDGLRDLLAGAVERLPDGNARPLSPALRAWFERALPLDSRKPFAKALDAGVALDDVVKADRAYRATSADLKQFYDRATDWLSRQRSSATAAPDAPAAVRAGAPVAAPGVEHRRPPLRVVPPPSDDEADEIRALEAELARLRQVEEEEARAAAHAAQAAAPPDGRVAEEDDAALPLAVGEAPPLRPAGSTSVMAGELSAPDVRILAPRDEEDRPPPRSADGELVFEIDLEPLSEAAPSVAAGEPEGSAAAARHEIDLVDRASIERELAQFVEIAEAPASPSEPQPLAPDVIPGLASRDGAVGPAGSSAVEELTVEIDLDALANGDAEPPAPGAVAHAQASGAEDATPPRLGDVLAHSAREHALDTRVVARVSEALSRVGRPEPAPGEAPATRRRKHGTPPGRQLPAELTQGSARVARRRGRRLDEVARRTAPLVLSAAPRPAITPPQARIAPDALPVEARLAPTGAASLLEVAAATAGPLSLAEPGPAVAPQARDALPAHAGAVEAALAAVAPPTALDDAVRLAAPVRLHPAAAAGDHIPWLVGGQTEFPDGPVPDPFPVSLVAAHTDVSQATRDAAAATGSHPGGEPLSAGPNHDDGVHGTAGAVDASGQVVGVQTISGPAAGVEPTAAVVVDPPGGRLLEPPGGDTAQGDGAPGTAPAPVAAAAPRAAMPAEQGHDIEVLGYFESVEVLALEPRAPGSQDRFVPLVPWLSPAAGPAESEGAPGGRTEAAPPEATRALGEGAPATATASVRPDDEAAVASAGALERDAATAPPAAPAVSGIDDEIASMAPALAAPAVVDEAVPEATLPPAAATDGSSPAPVVPEVVQHAPPVAVAPVDDGEVVAAAEPPVSLWDRLAAAAAEALAAELDEAATAVPTEQVDTPLAAPVVPVPAPGVTDEVTPAEASPEVVAAASPDTPAPAGEPVDEAVPEATLAPAAATDGLSPAPVVPEVVQQAPPVAVAPIDDGEVVAAAEPPVSLWDRLAAAAAEALAAGLDEAPTAAPTGQVDTPLAAPDAPVPAPGVTDELTPAEASPEVVAAAELATPVDAVELAEENVPAEVAREAVESAPPVAVAPIDDGEVVAEAEPATPVVAGELAGGQAPAEVAPEAVESVPAVAGAPVGDGEVAAEAEPPAPSWDRLAAAVADALVADLGEAAPAQSVEQVEAESVAPVPGPASGEPVASAPPAVAEAPRVPPDGPIAAGTDDTVDVSTDSGDTPPAAAAAPGWTATAVPVPPGTSAIEAPSGPETDPVAAGPPESAAVAGRGQEGRAAQEPSPAPPAAPPEPPEAAAVLVAPWRRGAAASGGPAPSDVAASELEIMALPDPTQVTESGRQAAPAPQAGTAEVPNASAPIGAAIAPWRRGAGTSPSPPVTGPDAGGVIQNFDEVYAQTTWVPPVEAVPEAGGPGSHAAHGDQTIAFAPQQVWSIADRRGEQRRSGTPRPENAGAESEARGASGRGAHGRDEQRPATPAVGPAAPSSRGRWLPVAAVVLLLAGGGVGGYVWFARPAPRGDLVVTSTQDGLEVLVDGTLVGKTPATVAVAPGRRTIELRGFGASQTLPVEVIAGERTTTFVDWGQGVKTGSLKVTSSPPGARVLMGAEIKGVTPVTVEHVPVGTHEIVVESDKGSVRTTVKIAAGKTAAVDVPIYSGFLVVFAPVELRIFEAGRLIGTTLDGRLLMSPGEHKIELVNPTLGYQERRTVVVTPGRVTAVSVTAIAGELDVDAPAGTEVLVDGESRGVAPTRTLRVGAGTREVVLRHPELGQRRFVVTVGTKGPARVSFTGAR